MVAYLLLQKNNRVFLLVRYPDRYHIIAVNHKLDEEKEEKMLSGYCSDAAMDEMGLTRETVMMANLRGVGIGGCRAGDAVVLYMKDRKLKYVLSDDGDENIDAVLYEYGDDSIFVAANMSDKPQTVTLDGISGTWYHFRHNRTFTGNTFELKPYEVLIGTRQMKDRKLPTYQQTAALIDRLEAERLSNKSLLFDRLDDIEISTPSSQWTRHKLFDGVKDNLACELRGKDLFLELGLKKVAPTFNKIVLSGWHLEDAVIKVRINGEMITLEPESTQNEEFSATYLLKEPITPDALRFEFPQEFVELYEVEVF